MNPTPTKHNSSAHHVFYTGKFSLDPSFPKYYILSASGGCQVSSGDDNDTHKYKDNNNNKDNKNEDNNNKDNNNEDNNNEDNGNKDDDNHASDPCLHVYRSRDHLADLSRTLGLVTFGVF